MNTIAAAMIILILICPRISRSPIIDVIMDLKLIIVVVNIVLITITVIAIINCNKRLNKENFPCIPTSIYSVIIPTNKAPIPGEQNICWLLLMASVNKQ